MRLDTPLCDFGWQAPDFTLHTPDGTAHSLSDQAGQPVLVTFICNHCPYVVAIADRLAADARVLMAEGVAVLAVMSNDWRDYPADAPDRMVEFAAKHDFPFPYLVDAGQHVGNAWGAICTPDFFGLNADHQLQYRGRLDDAGRGDAPGRTPDLLDAMRQIAQTGQGPRDQVPSMGCSIKWT